MKLQQIFFIGFFVIGFACNVSGQERKHKELKHEKRHKLANNLINKGSYYSAISHLEDNAQRHPKNDNYLMRLADAFYLSRDYKNAELWYSKVVAMQKKVSLAMYKYASSLKYNGKYVEARDLFKTFSQSKYRDNKKEKYKSLAKNEYLSCEWAINNNVVNDDTEIYHLGDDVNSRYSEFAPVLLNDSILVFSSLQSDTVIVVDSEESHSYHVKILSSNKENDQWGPHSEVLNVNTLYENNANGTFSLDRKRFYFTRCIPDGTHSMICSIYMSEIVEGVMQKPVKLDDKINKKGFTSTQPNIGMVSASNKQKYEVLFYSSNRSGGKGGLDIWYSIITSKGDYMNPVNAGNVINTMGDEITPYFNNHSHVLYFSSNYHFGYGGYDVFKAKGTMNQWQKPVNLNKPVNSRVDDTYYSINSYNNNGFFVSNRPEGYHLTSETCCDDIYNYNIKNPFALKLQAFSVKDTLRPVDVKFVVLKKPADSISNLIDSNFVKKSINAFKDTISLNALINNTLYPEIGESKNNFSLNGANDYVVYAIGKYDTSVYSFRSLKMEHDVTNVYAEDSLTDDRLIEGKGIDFLWVRFYLDADSVKPVVASKQVVLEKETVEDEKTFTVTKFVTDVREKKTGKIILNYDFDDARFIEIHAPGLDSLADVLKEYPELRINISAHTDDKGSPEYNLLLSKKRSRSIEIYLVNKGIDKKRMISNWYGESQPLVPNSNPDGSDNPENRHYNRRAEITIIE